MHGRKIFRVIIIILSAIHPMIFAQGKNAPGFGCGMITRADVQQPERGGPNDLRRYMNLETKERSQGFHFHAQI